MATSTRTVPVNSGFTILNGTSTGKNDDRFDVWVEYKVTQNVTNNTSAVEAYFYSALKSGKSSTTRQNSGLNSTFSVNGVSGTVRSNASYDFTDPKEINELGEYLGTIAHNADGTKSVAIKGSFTTKSDYISGGSISKTITLPTIARASAPTVSTTKPEIGTAFTISTNRASSAFTHTLTYGFAGKTGTIATKVGASYAWTPPYTLAADIPNATSGTCVITCDTYNGSTKIGSNKVSVVLTVPNNDTTKPTFTLALTPYHTDTAAENDAIVNTAGGTVSLAGKYVKARSKVKAAFTASSAYSSIKSYTLTVGGKAKTSTTAGITELISDLILNAGEVSAVFRVTDARGYYAEETVPITVIDYAAPKLTKVQVFRCLEDGTKNDDGTYVYVRATKSYSKLTGENTAGGSVTQGNLCSMQFRYKPVSDSEYSAPIVLIPETDVETDTYAGVLPDVAMPYTLSFDVELSAKDLLGEKYTIGIPIATAQTDFNLNNNKAAFGKYAEKEGTLEVDWYLYMHDHKIQAVADPEEANDAATKNYVDSVRKVVDVTSLIKLTPSTNCKTAEVVKAFRTGNVVTVRINLTTSAAVAAGGNLDATLQFTDASLTPVDVSFGASFLSTQIFGTRLTSSDVRYRIAAATSSGTTLNAAFTYICTG